MKPVRKYPDIVDGMDQCGQLLRSLIEELLRQERVQFQYVSYRVKSEESARKKLSLKPDRYHDIEELTDILGIRIITYFPRDVDKVAEIIRREFTIDESNSVDKRKLLDPDKFGYMSLHFVASLTESRSHLVEYKRFSETSFEIQIRSVLQHAWAEIEHDLGYKTESGLPEELRRSFSRIAGVLELADEEFERIRDSSGKYEKHVRQTIDKAPQKLPIDQSTLTAAVENEKLIQKLDSMIAKLDDVPLQDEISARYMGSRAADLKILGIKNLDQLLKTASHYEKYIESFARYWLARPNRSHTKADPFPRGVSLFYLSYVLAAQREHIDKTEWMSYMPNGRDRLLGDVRAHWKKVVGDLGEPKPLS